MKAFTDMMATHLTTANTSAVVAVAPSAPTVMIQSIAARGKRATFGPGA